MAAPVPGSQEDAVIKELRSTPFDRAEVFYLNAKDLCEPSTGFEDSGVWSIKALTLMSVYMLAVSKRNAAYAYHGKFYPNPACDSSANKQQEWQFAQLLLWAFIGKNLTSFIMLMTSTVIAVCGEPCSYSIGFWQQLLAGQHAFVRVIALETHFRLSMRILLQLRHFHQIPKVKAHRQVSRLPFAVVMS